MATLEEIVVQLSADSSDLKAQMISASKATEQATKRMEDAVKSFSENSTKNTSFFQQSMASLVGFVGGSFVTGALNKAGEAFRFLGSVMLDGAKEAIEEEKQLNRLATSLALSGKYSEEAVNSLQDFIDTQESLTATNSEAITSNLALLSSLTKLDSEGLKRAQQAALDLAAATGKDLDTATQAVAKSLNGSSAALEKMGLKIDDSKDKTVQFNNVMQALEGQFKGASTATNNFAGAQFRLTDSFGDLFKTLAKAFTENRVVVAMMNEIANIFKGLEGAAKGAGGTLADTVGGAFISIAKYSAIAVEMVNQFITIMERGLRTILLPINLVADGLRNIAQLVSGDEIKPFESTTAQLQSISDLGTGANTTLGSLAQKLADVAAAGEGAFQPGNNSIKEGIPAVQNMTNAVKELTQVQQMLKDQASEFAKQQLEDSLSLEGAFKREMELNQLKYDSQATSFQEFKDNELAMLQFYQEQQNEILLQGAEFQKFSEQEKQMAITELQAKQNNERLKLAKDLKDKEEALNQQKLQGFSSFFGNLASLQQSSSKEMAAVGKAAALAQATIDGYAAVQGAYKQGSIIGGPPLGAAFAAAAAIATAANVSKIAGVGFNKGTDSVPGVGNQDTVPAMLTPGERVLTQEQNKDLTQFLANANQSGGQGATFTFNISIAPGTGITREQANDLVEAINNNIAAGGQRLLRDAIA